MSFQSMRGVVLVLLPFLYPLGIVYAQISVDERIVGEWQGQGTHKTLKLHLAQDGTYTISRNNQSIKHGAYSTKSGRIAFSPSSDAKADESGTYQLEAQRAMVMETDLSGKVTWLRLSKPLPGAFGEPEKAKPRGLFAVDESDTKSKSSSTSGEESEGEFMTNLKGLWGEIKDWSQDTYSKTVDAGQQAIQEIKNKTERNAEQVTQQNSIPEAMDQAKKTVEEATDVEGHVDKVTKRTKTKVEQQTRQTTQQVKRAGQEKAKEIIQESLGQATDVTQPLGDTTQVSGPIKSQPIGEPVEEASNQEVSGFNPFESLGKLLTHSDTPKTTDTPASEAMVSSNASTSEFGPCELVMEQEISSALGRPITRSQNHKPHLVRSNGVLEGGDCFYQAPGDYQYQVVVHMDSAPGRDKKKMLAATRNRQKGGKTLQGIGEDAYASIINKTTAIVEFVQGNVLASVTVTEPKPVNGPEAAKTLAKFAAQRISSHEAQIEVTPKQTSSSKKASTPTSVVVNQPSIKAPKSPVKLSELKLMTGPGMVLIDSGLATKARKKAVEWKKDAILVEIHAKGGPNGMVNLQVTPDGAAFVFKSPSTPGQGLTVMPTKEGPLVTFPLAMSQADQPIPNTFLSLPEAVAYARQAGFKDQDFGTSLRVMDSGMLGWTFMSFGNPLLSKALVIDATTGATTNYQEASGIGARQRFAEEMKKPKMLSGAAATSYRAMRREADAMATQWYSDMQLTHVSLVGTSLGSSLTINTADFDYVGFPAKGKAWTVSVNVRNGQMSSSGGQGVHPVRGPGKPVSSNIVDAEKALGTLLSRAGFLGGAVGLELFLVGQDGGKTSNFGQSIFGSIFPGTIHSSARPELVGKSIWRLLVVNKQVQVINPNDQAVRRGGSPGGVFDRSTADWAYLDAVTGEPL